MSHQELVDKLKGMPPALNIQNLVELGLFPTANIIYHRVRDKLPLPVLFRAGKTILFTHDSVFTYMVDNNMFTDSQKPRQCKPKMCYWPNCTNVATREEKRHWKFQHVCNRCWSYTRILFLDKDGKPEEIWFDVSSGELLPKSKVPIETHK